MRQLEGKVALVTGASGGIGRAVVERFAAEGASVVAFDRGAPDAAASPAVATVTGDVRSAADNRRAVETALARFGRLDVFVGNAGVYDNRHPFERYGLDELDAAFDELFAIDVKGYLLGARASLDALRASRGSIVFTSSVSGSRAGFGGALYVAAKHAVDGLTRQLAWELAPDVRVNAVAPGYVPTGLGGLAALRQPPSTGGPGLADLPLGAFARADDLASAYLFLAADAGARNATGTVLALDGGAALDGPRRPLPRDPPR